MPRTRRDLPMPGSPEMSTTRPSPALARAHRRNSSSISSSRPTSGVNADPRNASNRLSTTLGRNTCQARTGAADALHLDRTEIAILEQIADQPAGARGDDYRVRLRQGLQPGGEVRRLPDDRLLLRRALPDQIADDDQPGGNPDARLELDGFDIEATDGVDRAQPRPHRPLGIVLMRAAGSRNRPRPPSPMYLETKPSKPGDDFGDGAVICAR